jgi:pimeloyl-ACP methyl ester carboxylesterase
LGDGELEIFRARLSTAEPEAYVLRFYGNADRAERWLSGEAAAWPNRALELWGVNYPGYGASSGPARLQGVADAALAAYDAVRKVAGTRPIYVFGTSLGTTAALHVAAEREVAGLVLQNPPALRQLIVGDHGWWNLWLVAYPVSRQIPAALDSVANARRARCPAVFLLADQDEVVRPRYHRLVVDAFAGPKEVLIQEGARHNTPMSSEFGRRMHVAVDRLFAARLGR